MTDYARLAELSRRHHERFVRYVTSHPRKLICQDCGGAGGWVEVVLHETGQGPWIECGWCEGTGYITPYLRGMWLRFKKRLRRL